MAVWYNATIEERLCGDEDGRVDVVQQSQVDGVSECTVNGVCVQLVEPRVRTRTGWH